MKPSAVSTGALSAEELERAHRTIEFQFSLMRPYDRGERLLDPEDWGNDRGLECSEAEHSWTPGTPEAALLAYSEIERAFARNSIFPTDLRLEARKRRMLPIIAAYLKEFGARRGLPEQSLRQAWEVGEVSSDPLFEAIGAYEEYLEEIDWAREIEYIHAHRGGFLDDPDMHRAVIASKIDPTWAALGRGLVAALSPQSA